MISIYCCYDYVHISSEWRLLIDSFKRSLKCVILHNVTNTGQSPLIIQFYAWKWGYNSLNLGENLLPQSQMGYISRWWIFFLDNKEGIPNTYSLYIYGTLELKINSQWEDSGILERAWLLEKKHHHRTFVWQKQHHIATTEYQIWLNETNNKVFE